LNDAFFENESLMFLVAAIALIVAVILLLLIFRRTIRRRLHVTASGEVPPRLGVADSFDLNRRRLVIVRRDDVEHLIIIGGPTDLVVKAKIIHAEGRDLGEIREGTTQDKELKEAMHMSAGTFRPRAVEPRCKAIRIQLALAQTRIKLATMRSISSGLIPLALLSSAAGAASGFIGRAFPAGTEAGRAFPHRLTSVVARTTAS
jgi:hypothetical protein